ncbi:MAG TPA: molybdopterin-guanine dinucleotide biosynthesis protein B [Candidatus Tripitaka californicus]|uniref:molybdopterin-guanine dinucleotide biosynthesis protein B n=1 Tax=Candidatus Tripitaka californicus TaxID=3367616 RepID=UPI0040256A61
MGNSRRVPFVAIVGRKKIGKTSLIEGLLPLLKKGGYRVGVLKYDVREFQIDYPGKDTYRSYQAGADSILISSPDKLAFIKGLDSTPPLKRLINKYFSDTDLVLIEGYKGRDCPEIHLLEPSEAASCSVQSTSGGCRPQRRGKLARHMLTIKKKAPEAVSPQDVRAALNFIKKLIKKS